MNPHFGEPRPAFTFLLGLPSTQHVTEVPLDTIYYFGVRAEFLDKRGQKVARDGNEDGLSCSLLFRCFRLQPTRTRCRLPLPPRHSIISLATPVYFPSDFSITILIIVQVLAELLQFIRRSVPTHGVTGAMRVRLHG